MFKRLSQRAWSQAKPYVASKIGPVHRGIGFTLDLDKDLMTGLPVRSYLVRHLKMLVDQISAGSLNDLAVIYIDLDNFKWVNDTYGHDVADALVIMVAQRLQELTRGRGFAARVGGDEFVVVILNQGSSMRAQLQARQFHHALCGEYRVDGVAFDVEASFGFEWCSQKLGTLSGSTQKKNPHMSIVDRAERAMYLARDELDFGIPNIVRYQHEAWQDRQGKETYKRLLQEAILNGEFDILYQPIVNLLTGQIESVEALMRPGGWVSKYSLEQDMAIFEKSSVAPAFSTAVMTRVGSDMALWANRMGSRAVGVHINMSPNQLASDGTVNRTRQLCSDGLIQPHMMTIEITEREPLSARRELLPRMEELEELGFCFALDDFGAKHSSIARILDLPPITNIKLDGDITQKVQDSARARDIIAGVVKVLADAGFSVTAEKISNTQQASMFTDMGCRYGQGFFFHPPLSIEDLNSLLTNCRTPRTPGSS